ncbi:cytochrome c5 family protein [Wenzhouxiangella sp. XN79A]|uniref:c-type cytochrome n=1 Tax=Wenzhouxiangella sp. XN79A TaxID=2724193 RepID=UPI00144ABB96|nr:cytochrome c5 family protein [Wenzhouxiangella sp. XN79A]
MSEQDDQIFLKRFSLVIVALAIFAVIIIFVALQFHRQLGQHESPTRTQQVAERIAPVAGVYAGETGRAAAMAAAEAAQADEAPQVAFDGSLDGEMIYNNVCAACHNSGAAGAPMLVASDWTDRMPQGEDTLVQHAIDGIGTMPAKGGRMDLSDEQVRASVEYMLAEIE